MSSRGGYRGVRNNNPSSSSSRRGRGGGGGSNRRPDDACFKCGQIGHISRDCTNQQMNPRGGASGRGRGGRGRGNLDLNIDGTLKNDVGKILKEFQENPDLTEYAFPPDLNNTERRFIHTFCKNFGLTSKSTGGPKGSPNRYCVIYKNREKKEERASRRHPLATLTFQNQGSANLVDGFLQHFQLPEQPASAFLSQEEVDLKALAAAYVAPKNTAEMLALSANLKQLHDAREQQRQSTTPSQLQHFRSKLPIYAQREEILRMIDANQVIVLSSSTGSGKSTQVPQYLLEHLDGLGVGGKTDIIVTQPRRISAMSLAQRVAQEREVEKDPLGSTVGYQIRLEACKSNKTRLLYCTIGVLLRRLSTDRLLTGISHIIVDEVHERDRLCDFLLIILKDVLPIRKDLKLILMSATLNADLFSAYFNNCPHIHIEGFTYPVHTFYLEDVIELTGYQPPSLNRLAPGMRKQQEAAKEKKLRDMLNMVMNQVLTLEAKVPEKKVGHVVINPHHLEDEEEGKDDEAALAALANIAALGGEESSSFMPISLEPTNKVTGWTDTYVYKPEVENPFSTGESTSSSDANMLSSLDAIIAGESADSASPFVTGSSTTIKSPPSKPPTKHLHPSEVSKAAISSSLTMLSKPNSSPPPGTTLQNPLSGLKYSQDTMDAIRRIEEEGMDYIDYDLILQVIVFICQRFDESLMGGQPKVPKKKSKTERAQMEEDEEDPINIYNGSILVFIPGWEDICKLLDMVATHPVLNVARKYLCLPLHGSISSQQQRLIFQKPAPGQRKIIFSTNIAETSITIDDVVFVIDSGKMKEKTYDAMTKMCALSSTWVSQANAKQRSGRAGRCRRGVCFRLYTTAKYNSMDVFQTPELLRTPLEELCLQVKLLRLGRVETFLSKALQPPAQRSVLDALELLTRLGALDTNEGLTILGEYLAAMPLDPRLAKMILFGAIFKCLDPILTIAAALSYRDPFVLPVQWERERAQQARQKLSNGSQSDMLCLLNAYHGYAHQMATGGMRAAGNFCREHFLSMTTMQMIEKLKVQYMDTLKETGWLDHLIDSPNGAAVSSGGRAKRHHDHSAHSSAALKSLRCDAAVLNEHQYNISVLTAIICLGMYPMCAKVQPQNPQKKRRAILCTRNNLQNICLHPACCSSQDFRRAAAKNSAWTDDCRINLANPDEPPSYVQYCVFFESMRSSEVYLRNVHWVQPLLLALFGTGDRHKLQIAASPEPTSSPLKKRGRRAPRREDFDEETGEEMKGDEEEDDDDDEDEDEDGEDDEYPDEEESADEDEEANGNIFHVDEWIRFGVKPVDGQRLVSLRQYLSFILDSFMRRSGAHSHGASSTPESIHLADQAVAFFVKLLHMEIVPTGIPSKPQPQQYQPQQQFQRGGGGVSQQPNWQRMDYSQSDRPQSRGQDLRQQQPQQLYQPSRIQSRPTSAAPSQPQSSSSMKPPLTVQEIERNLMKFQLESQQQPQQQQQQPSSSRNQQLYEPPQIRGGGRGGGVYRGGKFRGGKQKQQEQRDSSDQHEPHRGGGRGGPGGRGRGGRRGGQHQPQQN